MTGRVLIYGKEKCPFTSRAREFYGADAEYRDVLLNPAHLTEMLLLTGGLRRIPVIVADGEVRVGFEGRT